MCRFLDLSNSSFGQDAHLELREVVDMPQLEVCILKVRPADEGASLEAALQGVRLA